jgi:Subtilase family
VSATEQDRQIVVATDHLRVVGAELGQDQVEKAATNGRLGLTLVTVRDVAHAGATLAKRRATEFPQAEPPEVSTALDRALAQCRAADTEQIPPPEPSSYLDRVLAELRCLCEQRYTGWHPTVGKNRTLTGVQFKPYTNGADKPTPAPGPTATGPVDGSGERVRVGLFDTRLAPHPLLTGRFLADDGALLGPVAAGRQRLWWQGHATFIAGIVRRRAPSAVLDVRAALRPGADPSASGAGAADVTGDEHWALPVWDFASTLAAYQDAGVAVINLSVGLCTEDGRAPLVLERAIAQLTPSTIVVAAAGNHGSPDVSEEKREEVGLPARGAPLFPAALDNVLAVGALNGDVAADFNPCGAGGTGLAPWIDVCAPGVDTVSSYLGDGGGEKVLVRDVVGNEEIVDFAGWASWSGTSFAAGEITGALAALLGKGYKPADAVAAIRRTFPRP